MLFKTQTENLGRQVNVPVSHVLLYEIVHHPVEEQQVVKQHRNTAETLVLIYQLQTGLVKHKPVNQLLCDQVCAARLLMMDNQRDVDLQLLLQLFVDLTDGSFTRRISAS